MPNEKDQKDGLLRTLIKGGLVGVANIIPGVSGGTFALILGIFDRMVAALNAINIQAIRSALGLVFGAFRRESRERFLGDWRRIDGSFLVTLGLGAVLVIGSSSFLIKYLLQEHYSPTLAFFVGLILPSISIPWAMMERKGSRLLWCVPGIGLTVGVSLIMPDSAAGSDNLLLAAATGAIAISAMILPGLSGSYVMLVMGQYQNVLEKLTGMQKGFVAGEWEVVFDAALWLSVLALGMVVGIVLFARLLHFLLARYRSATMAFLIGLLIGSLWVLWPFKDIESGAEVVGRSGEVKEEVKIATASNRLPANSTEGLLAGGAMLAGLVGSAGLIVIGRRRESRNGS